MDRHLISKSKALIHFDRSPSLFTNHYGDPLEVVNGFYEKHTTNVGDNSYTHQASQESTFFFFPVQYKNYKMSSYLLFYFPSSSRVMMTNIQSVNCLFHINIWLFIVSHYQVTHNSKFFHCPFFQIVNMERTKPTKKISISMSSIHTPLMDKEDDAYDSCVSLYLLETKGNSWPFQWL